MPRKLKNNPEKTEKITEPPAAPKKRGRPKKSIVGADGVTIHETSVVATEDKKPEKNGEKPKTYEWFCAIIYPEHEPLHAVFLDYVTKYETEYAWIKHDQDKDENGELKKPHVHIIFRHFSKVTMNTIRKIYACWKADTYIQHLTDVTQMAYYLTHQTPDAIAQGKHRYPVSDVHHSIYFDRIYRKLNKTEILFNSQKRMLSDALLEHGADTINKALKVIDELHLDFDGLTEYMLVQMVNDVRYLSVRAHKIYTTVDSRGTVLSQQHYDYKPDPFDELKELEEDDKAEKITNSKEANNERT